MAREEGIKVGPAASDHPHPFPVPRFAELASAGKRFMAVEMSCGQMVEDVRLAVNGKAEVSFYGRSGGAVLRRARYWTRSGGGRLMQKVFERPKGLTDVEFGLLAAAARTASSIG